jgi:DNA-binding transcriptional LysR family regulator
MTELRRLRYFAQIVEAGGFRLAARQLGLTQPGLTAQIQRLERDLGLPVFDRTRKPARPTPAGEAILREVHALFAYLDRFEQDLATIVAQHRTLRLELGVAYQAPARLLAALARFGELNPDVDVTLKEELRAELLRAMRKGELDACVVPLADPAEPLPTQYRTMPLLAADWVFIVPAAHRLAAYQEVSLAELADERFVLSSGASGAAVKTALARTGPRRPVAWETTGPNLIPALVDQGRGIGFVPPDFDVRLSSQLGLHAFSVTDVHFAYNFVLVWVERAPHGNALQLLLTFLKSCDWPAG